MSLMRNAQKAVCLNVDHVNQMLLAGAVAKDSQLTHSAQTEAML